MPDVPTSVAIERTSKSYGALKILDNVSVAVAAGEFVTLLGPSGSGKTTLLNIIAGFAHPDEGRILIGQEDVTSAPPHRRGIGLVFQNYALFPHMTVAENVAFPLKARRVGQAHIAEAVAWALGLVKLKGFGDRAIGQLSGGQKQRVALARAVVFHPRVILMDEPLSALDKQLREHMQVEIRALHERIGATTIYVTHDQREALTMSDRIAVLNGGYVAQFGTPREIYDRPADAFVAEFVGEATLATVRRVDTYAVELAGARIETAHPVPPGDNLRLVLRSEKLVLAAPDDGNLLRGRVLRRLYQGESQVLIVELDGGPTVTIRQAAHATLDGRLPREGEHAAFSLHPEHAVVISATPVSTSSGSRA
jgi:putative spermidine/putrescine transport system ATP-binding protein